MRLTHLVPIRLPFGRPLLAAAACMPILTAARGKDENLNRPSLLEFRHSMPESPRQLETRIPTAASTSGHPIAATDHHLFLVDRDNRTLVRLDRATLTPEASLPLPGRPEQLALGADGAIVVTLRNTGEVVRVNPDLELDARVKLGTDVHGVAFAPDGKTLYVSLPRDGQLVTLDALTFEELDRTNLGTTPRGLVASQNGWLLITHETGDAVKLELDTQGLPIGGITDIKLRRANPNDHLRGSRLQGLKSTRSIAATIDPASGGAYLAHITAFPGDPASAPIKNEDSSMTTSGYGTSAPTGLTFDAPARPIEISVTPVTGGGTIGTIEADFPVKDIVTGEPMVHLIDQPSDIAHHPTWSLLFVTGYGTDNVLVMSTAEGDPMRSTLGVIDVGRAPRGIAFSPDGEFAYVLNEHDLTVSRIDLAPFFVMEPASAPEFNDAPNGSMAGAPMALPDFGHSLSDAEVATSDPTPDSPRVSPLHLEADSARAYGRDPLPAPVREGARVFTFARNENLSHAGQFACGSCHFEGTEDKLVWVISDGPRQTPALAGRLAGTAPFNWAGTKDSLQDNMSQTVERMGGLGLNGTELANLEQFLLHGLEVPNNPNLAPDGAFTADQLAGKAIFESNKTGCSSCHQPERNFTDGISHDVGTGSETERMLHEIALASDPEARPPWMLDTPTLKGLFYTAPYFHDGSAPDLWAVLEREGSRMGQTSHLSYMEKKQLIAYLLTL